MGARTTLEIGPTETRYGLFWLGRWFLAQSIPTESVETIYGRTSNPGVIHIGQSVGRRLRRIVLRRDGPFISPDRIASLLA